MSTQKCVETNAQSSGPISRSDKPFRRARTFLVVKIRGPVKHARPSPKRPRVPLSSPGGSRRSACTILAICAAGDPLSALAPCPRSVPGIPGPRPRSGRPDLRGGQGAQSRRARAARPRWLPHVRQVGSALRAAHVALRESPSDLLRDPTGAVLTPAWSSCFRGPCYV